MTVDTGSSIDGILRDCDVNVAVDLCAHSEDGVVIGVFVDGVDIAEATLDDDDFLFEELLSQPDSDYWEMEDEELVELVEMQAESVQHAEETRALEEGKATSAGHPAPICTSDTKEQQQLPASSPLLKSRRIIGRLVRGPAAEERAAELCAKGMNRSQSLTILAKKKPKCANNDASYSLAVGGNSFFGESVASNPWAAPWSPNKAPRSPQKAFVLQGGSGQLARALSTGALPPASAMSMDLSSGSAADAPWKSAWAPAPRLDTTTTYKFQKVTKQAPAPLARPSSRGNGYMLPSLSPELHVAMTGSKRGGMIF